MTGLAIIAGRGALPRLLAEDCARRNQAYTIVRFKGLSLDWLADHPVIEAGFEQFGALFAAMREVDCQNVVFAGGMDRPQFDMGALDAKTAEILPDLMANLGKGDDQTLRAVIRIFEAEGFTVKAAQDILPDLLASVGAMGAVIPSPADLADCARACEIATALGTIDVGQGAVVAQGLCLGLESLQGTDVMLDFVARSAVALRPDSNGAGGVLFKGPKPGQDLRVDLPAIGPQTLEYAARAGLAGVAVTAGKVLILERAETLATADRRGLFVWGMAEAGS